MEDKLFKYRKKKSRCRYCKYKQTIPPPCAAAPTLFWCILKHKILRDWGWRTKGCVCRWYTPKEKEGK